MKEIRLKMNDTKKSNSSNPPQIYERNPFKMNDQKNRFNCTKEMPSKLTTQKNQILIIHFNFIYEIP